MGYSQPLGALGLSETTDSFPENRRFVSKLVSKGPINPSEGKREDISKKFSVNENQN
jgi:hypothetical protein